MIVPSHKLDGSRQVGVIRDNYGDVVIAFEAIHQEVRGQVDVRPLLVGANHLDGLRAFRRGMGQVHHLGMGKEAAKVNRQVWDCAECAQIDVLAPRLPRVGGRRSDAGREVSYSLYVVVGKDLPAQGGEVEPPVGRVLDTAVVEVEAVDVDVGGHAVSVKKAGAVSSTAPRPAPEGPGEVSYIIAQAARKVICLLSLSVELLQ